MSVGEGIYWVRNLEWVNKVLGLELGFLADGSSVLAFNQLGTFNATLSQLWIVERFRNKNKYIIRNLNSNLVLDLAEEANDDGVSVICRMQHGGNSQQWSIEHSNVNGPARCRIINVATGTAIHHTGDDSKTFTVAWRVNDSNRQLWSLEPFIYPLIYRLRVKRTGRVLELANGSATNNTAILAKDRPGMTKTRNQLWWLQDKPGSQGYTIQCLETATVADLTWGRGSNGTRIIGFESRDTLNQQWRIDNLQGGYQKITNVVSGTVMDAFKRDSAQRVGGWHYTSGDNQQWFLDAVPSPGLGWVLIQNGGTGKFLCCTLAGWIDCADAPETAFDGFVQWRFLQKEHTGIYTLVNRATGRLLRQSSFVGRSISLVQAGNHLSQDSWFLEVYASSDANLVSIINKETGNVLEHLDGQSIQALVNATDGCNRSWKIMPANDWLTSFALVNGQCGLALSAEPGQDGFILSTVENVNDFSAQWIFRKIADGPYFSIQNKYNGYILGDSSASWRMFFCGAKKYLAVCNSASRLYLTLRSGMSPTLEDGVMTGDLSQCWELVSGREQGSHYDFIYMDDDILEVLMPFLDDRRKNNMKCHIEERSANKPPKDRADWKIPQAGRVTATENNIVRQILYSLIERWSECDVIEEETDHIRTLINLSQDEARRVIGQCLPQSIRNAYSTSSQPNAVFRLNRQASKDICGNRYAHLQGKYGTDTYFHIIIPVGIKYGRQEIIRFLRASLEQSTSIVITPTTCESPSGGPRYQDEAGEQEYWIDWAEALLQVPAVKHSVL